MDDLITQSIKDAFLIIESRYIEQAKIAYGLGKENIMKVLEELQEQGLALWSV